MIVEFHPSRSIGLTFPNVLPAPISDHPASPDLDSVLKWWRTRPPQQFAPGEAHVIRQAVKSKIRKHRAEWSIGITDEVTIAIGAAIERMKVRVIGHAEIDLALSAVLAFAIEGDATSGVLISSALRRRGRLDPGCRRLGALWLGFQRVILS